MRILHVVVSLDIGGLERIVTDLTLTQQRQGHEVQVFSLNPTVGFRPELEAAGVGVTQGRKAGGLDLGMVRSIREVIRRHGSEVVHTHGYMPNYYAAAAMVGLPSAPNLICTVHDMGDRLVNRKLRTLYRLSVMRTSVVAMVGRQVHDRFVERGWVPARKAVTVINGIPTERFRHTQERRAAARKRLGYGECDFVIGAVGRLVGLKNHRALIRVMPELLRRWPQLKLCVIGGGELAETLAEEVCAHGVSEAVQLAGSIPGVSDLLPAFDVFAMPSLTEGLSIALLEACASRLPVVATEVGGNPEIIHDGDTGLLIPPDDEPALARALARMIEDDAFRQRCGQAAERWVEEHASIESVARSCEALYRRRS